MSVFYQLFEKKERNYQRIVLCFSSYVEWRKESDEITLFCTLALSRREMFRFFLETYSLHVFLCFLDDYS